tara:strand:+ start:684 stop:944 length:261 start_codon:yes stop_codon:yes gene_type:complete
MRKEFKQNESWIEVEIFRKIIKVRHNFTIDYTHPLKPQYSCYDLTVLKVGLKYFFSELMIETIILWIEENCKYLNDKNEGQQISLF